MIKLLTCRELAKMCSLSEADIRALCRRSHHPLKHITISTGKRECIRIAPEWLDEWILEEAELSTRRYGN